ncbi:hypothetical protein SISSUDRAFT_355738 [Sistotremastrum suecicum HHB10207 ss-3]|uniref:Uncharacterized protein n=1 Tax=Sistotremastrum suecicum HHB10207 ss-3 TaxID=1314776 RepID=A0A165Z7Y1_9AGAM|nr:hypothetical protein SISSUDRAFT_355738 [Sistotremastrum suecicum HHB10207 ss-3]
MWHCFLATCVAGEGVLERLSHEARRSSSPRSRTQCVIAFRRGVSDSGDGRLCRRFRVGAVSVMRSVAMPMVTSRIMVAVMNLALLALMPFMLMPMPMFMFMIMPMIMLMPMTMTNMIMPCNPHCIKPRCFKTSQLIHPCEFTSERHRWATRNLFISVVSRDRKTH